MRVSRHSGGANVAEIESRVVKMYEEHPFPSIKDKRRKAESEMPLRLALLGIKPEDYVGKNLLDAGCGTGEYSCWYASRGSRVTAVDLSVSSLQRASEYAAQENITNIRFLRESILKLSFPDASFDYVSCMGVLHHTADPYAGFRELCRVLRPGGTIVVSLYNKFGRLRHNMKQRIVRAVAGENYDSRVVWARRLFPRTCRSLQKNRSDEPDVIIYDAFGIPHESQHTVGEVLSWFDSNQIDYLGAFGPVSIRDNAVAISLLRRKEFSAFRGYFDGFPVLARAVNLLPRVLGRGADLLIGDTWAPSRPTWFSRGVVQLCWFLMGFKFSIFSLAGRKSTVARDRNQTKL